MSNPAQLLVHNIRAMQSLSIQAKRDGQRQDFTRGTDGSASDITHTCTRAHTACSSCNSKHNNPALPQSTGGCYKGQWRATVSTWELVKQHNPNKTKKKKKKGRGEIAEAGRNISCQAQSPHPRPWWMHTDPWSVWNPRHVMVTHMSHLGRVSEATPPKCEDLDYFHWGKGN